MLFSSLILLLIGGCNKVDVADLGKLAGGSGHAGEIADPDLNFSGITSVTDKTDSTITLNWSAHADAVSYDVFRIIDSKATYHTTVVGQTASSVSLSGLTPGGVYKFRVRMKTGELHTDTNTNDVSVTMDSIPAGPVVAGLVSPSSASDFTDSAIIKISGVKSGDTIKLYSNSSCTSAVLVTGVSSGPTIDLAVTSLAVGSYSFYATATNYANIASACSSSFVSYTRNSCPAGYTFTSGTCIANFTGITSTSNKSDSTITLNWAAHADAVSYDVFTVSGPTVSYRTTVIGQSSSSVALSGLNPGMTYSFRVRMRKTSGDYDGSINDVSVTMNSAPEIPAAITLQSPNYSPALVAAPTVRVSGVKTGDTVKLYTDTSCTLEVASGISSGTTIDLTTSILAPGSYNFYARALNSVPNSSPCSFTSAVTVAYVRSQCPSGYLPITHNTSVGTTSDFCVMKYEARALKNDTSVLDADGCGEAGCSTVNWASVYHPTINTTGFRPVSVETGMPWRRISQNQAITACSNLGSGYSLISNEQWMTIARSVELVPSNWSTGNAGDGVMNRGFVNFGNTAPASSSQASCLYNSGADTCSATGTSDYKRTLITAVGSTDEIWDFSGNAWEWVNWNVTPAKKAYESGADNSVDRGGKDWKLINTLIGENGDDQMPDEKWASNFIIFSGGVPDTVASLDGANGLGRYYAGVNTSGGAAIRGGAWYYGTFAGAFALNLNLQAADTDTMVGFRCVYRP